jgi:hypothetical protein
MKKILTVSIVALFIGMITGCQSNNIEKNAELTQLNQKNSNLEQENKMLRASLENMSSDLDKRSSKKNETKFIETKEISLYYYNEKNDENFLFTEEFILPVKRNILISNTPIRETIDALFAINFSKEEVISGFSNTPYGPYNFEIKSLILDNGTLKIDFVDNVSIESMSSSESGIFFNSLKKTARQFKEIDKIVLENATEIKLN